VIVEAELEVVLSGAACGESEPFDPCIGLRRRRGRLDPRHDHATEPERLRFGGERGDVRLDHAERGVARACGEPELVEPATNGRGIVAVQLEELDSLEAHRGDRPQRSREVAGAVVPDGVEHEPDARHRAAAYVSPGAG
jgi:hypothetical protein